MTELSNTDPIIELTGKPRIELLTPLSCRVPSQSSGTSSMELSSPELSSTDPIIEPSGAEPSIELPRPSDEQSVGQSSVEPSAQPSAEQSSEKSSVELSGADRIIVPSGAEPSIEALRLLSDELSFEPSTAKPSTKLSSEDPIIELSGAKL